MTSPRELTHSISCTATWRDYLQLCKPRVVMLMILTAMVGMCLASPGAIAWHIFIAGNLGIALVAASAATINHLLEHHLDKMMRRTQRRPIVQGKITRTSALLFAMILALAGMTILLSFVNVLTTILTFTTLVGYAGIYTLYLKHATPQNIVIGGLAGAAPPLLGWAAVTGRIDPPSLLLVLIIFLWTPPHFWALAIYRIEDYAKANIPMLPNTHGITYTKLNIFLYTFLLSASTLLPFIIGMSRWIYLVGALILDAIFIYYSIKLLKNDNKEIAMKTFKYSIWYLMILFLVLLADHYFYLYF